MEDENRIGEEDTASEASEIVEEKTENEAADEEESAETEAVEQIQTEEPTETTEGSEPSGDVPAASKKRLGKRALIIAGIAVCAAMLIYFGGVVFYSTHFFWGTDIGVFDCSNMTPDKARKTIQNEIDNYSFTFYERDGKTEEIKGEEIYFSCTPVGELDGLKKEQNAFLWPASFRAQRLPLNVEVSYNKDVLYNRISQMDFMKKTRENMQGSIEKIRYNDGVYTIEDDGTKDIVSQNGVYQSVKPKILELYRAMSLEKEDCYKGLADDDTMKGVLNVLNKYVGTKVTYLNGDSSTVLDKNTINGWLSVDENYFVWIDEAKAKEYINNLSKSYDTVGSQRSFRTTGGSDITVSGGNYGWLMNNQKESEELLNIIRSGETVEREPVYKQKAAVHGTNDIGSTYIEVSIGSQHLWFYKDGNLVLSTDFVSGNPYKNNATPTGVYRVAYKDKNVILKGADYETPVTFWMPFNGGIGFHDALWRGAFGGSIYRGNGSHGCVNLPYNAAQTMYGSITPGDPVVVY